MLIQIYKALPNSKLILINVSLTWQITRHSLGIFSVPTIVLQTADVIPIREPRAREPCTISGYILGLHSKQHSFLGLTCIRKAEGKKAEGKKAGVKGGK